MMSWRPGDAVGEAPHLLVALGLGGEGLHLLDVDADREDAGASAALEHLDRTVRAAPTRRLSYCA